MKFEIEYTENIVKKTLLYDRKDLSFDMEPIEPCSAYDLVLNTLNLTVRENNAGLDTIVEIWGFCGLPKKQKGNYYAPISRKGKLIVCGKFEDDCGVSYRINSIDFPVYSDDHNGWVCIGNPFENYKLVEFIDNCIAVLNKEDELTALWLRPIYI